MFYTNLNIISTMIFVVDVKYINEESCLQIIILLLILRPSLDKNLY